MSGSSTAPPLNASGSDPIIAPPPPPPVDASNHPDDQARGSVGEMSPAEQAASAAARRAPAEPEIAAEVNPRAEAEPTEPPAAEATPEPATTKPEPKPDNTPPAIKAEITRERNRRREAEEAKAAADKRLEEALAALAALTPKPPPEPIAEPRPRREEFVSPEAHDAAMDAWAARNAEIAAERARTQAREQFQREAQEAAQRQQQEAAQREAENLAATWTAKREAALQKYPDYTEVAEADVHITQPMAEAILRTENGTDVAYYLGKNAEARERIASLPIPAQLVEIGKLSERLASPAPRAVSRAPAPISPIAGTREEATTVGREESMAEVAARVAAREARGRTPIIGGRAA